MAQRAFSRTGTWMFPPPRLPERLAEQTALQQLVQEALATVTAEDGPTQFNLTDPDAVLVKSRQGYQAGYNGQARVAGLGPPWPATPGC